MNKQRLFLLLFLSVAAAVLLDRYALAQPARPPKDAADVALHRLEHLLAGLSARGDTNTLAQVVNLIAAKDTLANTRDVAVSVVLLQHLHAGRTSEAIERLEATLDRALTSLGELPQEFGEPQTNAVKLARQYRTRYPREEKAGVTRAFDLLDKR